MAKPTMLDYVHQTPEVLRRQLASEVAVPLVDAWLTSGCSRLRIVACGSSLNAAFIARPFLRQMLRSEVLLTQPYTFCAYEHELPQDELCVVISQSGYSTNALAALDVIRTAGRAAIGITGDVCSDFSSAADVLIDYGVGEEQVGYVTVGVSSLVFFLALFGLGVAERTGRLDEAGAQREREALEEVVRQFESVTSQAPAVLARRYKELSVMERVFLVGAGPNEGIAREGALKFGECLQIPADALELEEYLHGPNLQLSPAYTVFVNAVGQRDHARARQIVDATRLVSDHVFVLTDDPDAQDADVRVEAVESLVAPLALLPFYQTLAFTLTEDEHLWHKHPLVARFDHALSGKSANYVDKEVL